RVEYHCDKNDCTLRIRDVRESDSAEYKFMFITNQPGGRFTGSPGVTLSVTELQVQVGRLLITQLELKCHSSCDVFDHPSYVWYNNGKKIRGEPPYYRGSVNVNDAYSCAVKGREGYHSPPVYPPKLPSVSVSPSAEIVEGSSVTLTCSSDANPAANYTWYKNNQRLLSLSSTQIIFSSIQSSDSGEYYCTAENKLGMRISGKISIDVKFPCCLNLNLNEDELAERVRNRVQGEGESVRDFAYMYQSLCKRWKPNIQEDEIIKLILKNINPQIASQLRSSGVTSVDGLVRLGQQLEKDRENQLQYEQRKNLLKKPARAVASEPAMLTPKRENAVRPGHPSQNQPPQVYCWRCKGSHAPAFLPTVDCEQSSSHLEAANPINSSAFSQEIALPCQLMVPLQIGPWTGIGIFDTGSSYTLINEDVWTGLRAQQDALKPWTRGPLYLADGEERQPIGWSRMTLALQTQQLTIPCVILPARSLAFPAVVGLDFIFLSGLQFDVSENCYWFKFNKKRQCQFVKESAEGSNAGLTPQLAFFSAIAPSQLVPPLPCHDLLQVAICNAHLDDFGKNMLLCQLQKNTDVCTTTLGCTSVLKHKIFSHPRSAHQTEALSSTNLRLGNRPGNFNKLRYKDLGRCLGVDLMGPFPRSTNGNLYLIVFVDYYTRWVEMFPLRKATAETVSHILTREILTRWGVPTFILSDQGPQFVSSVFEETCKQWNLKQKRTSPYHPQTNLTERVNRNVKAMIASYVEEKHKNWDKYIPEFRFALNSAVHESTGVTPAELNLSRPLKGPLDAELSPRLCDPDTSAYITANRIAEFKKMMLQSFPLCQVSPSAEIVEGSSVTLTCSSDANPAANYTWYKENEDSPKASGQIFTITGIRAEHSGNYYCEAENRRGRHNATLHLIVVADPPEGSPSDLRCSPIQLSEKQDDLHYVSVRFLKKKEDPIYCNVSSALPRRHKEEKTEEEETVEYSVVTFNGASTSWRSRGQEAVEDPAALHRTVNKHSKDHGKRNL
ncbi:hypothetical protein L3Q82_020019, partial [Scortum barcoo]